MRLVLAYGKHGLDVDLPADVVVVRPRHLPGLIDEGAALRQALRNPLGSPGLQELVRPGAVVVVVHSDLTRPMPNERVLPVLLQELEAAGVRRDDITLLNGLGTHRRQTPGELVEMLGDRLAASYRCLQHDGWDMEGLAYLGESSYGSPIWINRLYLEADVRILTGFIEPHLFAGFSGGPKAVLPGIAGVTTVMHNHGTRMVGHPRATWGVTVGNPLWEEMREVALLAGPSFLLNVTLNRERQITGVFAGDLLAAHQAGCEYCCQSAMVPVPDEFDIVITTNAGYPLDLNLYQSVKGMSAAAQIVKPGGSIILAAECRDGIPDHGEYANLLRSAGSPAELLTRIEQPGFLCHDQWEVQVQALIQMRAEVHVYSGGLSEQQLRQAMLTPCRRVEDTLQELIGRYGSGATVCALPEGPQTIPSLAARVS